MELQDAHGRPRLERPTQERSSEAFDSFKDQSAVLSGVER